MHVWTPIVRLFLHAYSIINEGGITDSVFHQLTTFLIKQWNMVCSNEIVMKFAQDTLVKMQCFVHECRIQIAATIQG